MKFFNAYDIRLTENMNTVKSIIRNLLLFGYIKRGKHNLYVVCNIEFKNTIPDQYMIASKIFLAFTFRSQRIVALANHVSSNKMEMCFCN